MHSQLVHHLAILTAAVVQWFLGWLWYGVLFKMAWKGLVGRRDGEPFANPNFVMAITFVANLVLAFVLAHLIVLAGAKTLLYGVQIGLIAGLGFVIPPMFAQHVSENRPFKLFGINSVYWLLAMAIGGAILAVWR